MEVGKINRFGVLVMTRQRIRPSIQHVTHETCPVCQGTGHIKNSEALVLSVLRRIKSILSKDSVVKIQIRISPLIAINLLNQRRSELAELEATHEAAIIVTPDHDITYGEVSMEIIRKEDEPERQKRHEMLEHKREPEEETVVLCGDAPISFDKALPYNNNEYVQNGRRGAQRAALDERERLRSLFEGEHTQVNIEPEVKATIKDKHQQSEEIISEPPKLTPEIIASLALPVVPRKRLVTHIEPDAPLSLPEIQANMEKKKTKAPTRKTGPKESEFQKISKTAKSAPAKSSANKTVPKTSSAGSTVKAKGKSKKTLETTGDDPPGIAKPKKTDKEPKVASGKPLLKTAIKARDTKINVSRKSISSVADTKKSRIKK
jgi:ribonuclease E